MSGGPSWLVELDSAGGQTTVRIRLPLEPMTLGEVRMIVDYLNQVLAASGEQDQEIVR